MFNLLLNFRWEIGEKMSSDRYYGDKALEYDNRRFGTNAGKMIYQLEKNTFTSLVRSVIVDNSRILEIATGTGRFIEILLGINNSVQICATDVSNEMITIAKDRVTKLNYNVDFINVDMMKLLDLIDISKYDLTFWVRIFTLLSKEKVLEFIEKFASKASTGSYLLLDLGNKGLLRRNKVERFDLNEIRSIFKESGYKLIGYKGVYFIPTNIFKKVPIILLPTSFLIDKILSIIFPLFTSRLFVIAKKVNN